MRAILMVCLGNICRSPMAEAAMRYHAEKAGVDINVDSVGTAAYHIGKAPDKRSQDTAMKYAQVDISHYKARQVHAEDFEGFDTIYAMDAQNLRDLENIRPVNSRAKLGLLLEEIGQTDSVADPYYGDISDFETVWRQVSAACEAIIRKY